MRKILIVLGALLFGSMIWAGLADNASPTANPSSDAATTSSSTSTDTPPAAHKGKATLGQRQALRSAQSYIELTGFSRAGLIRQLTSTAGDGFKRSDAEYAVDHVDANWNAEAVESAKSYLELTSFSRASLIRQLSSSAGAGFTLKQATYAADKVGL